MKKALTVSNVINQKITTIDFEQDNQKLFQAFGNPQNKGIWFVWGGSGSGKSSLVLDITKAFCKDYKAIHNELEEDLDDLDFINRLKLKNMQDIQENYLTASYNYEELCEYLDRKNSAKIVVINSATYFFRSMAEYLDFSRKYKRNKIIIIVGMAKGNNPYSELETKIMYDANKKIYVNGYLAVCKGRLIGPNGGLYTIWQEGYEKARGSEFNQ
jgi:predicted ATP-dependent serine protease